MGQPIVVIEKPSSRRGMVRFETNRALTGMGHERYRADQDVWGNRPPDELARRLFAHGGVARRARERQRRHGRPGEGLDHRRAQGDHRVALHLLPAGCGGGRRRRRGRGRVRVRRRRRSDRRHRPDRRRGRRARRVGRRPRRNARPCRACSRRRRGHRGTRAPGATEADPALATDAGDAAPEPDASVDPGAAVADPALARGPRVGRREPDDDEPDNDTSIADAARARSARVRPRSRATRAAPTTTPRPARRSSRFEPGDDGRVAARRGGLSGARRSRPRPRRRHRHLQRRGGPAAAARLDPFGGTGPRHHGSWSSTTARRTTPSPSPGRVRGSRWSRAAGTSASPVGSTSVVGMPAPSMRWRSSTRTRRSAPGASRDPRRRAGRPHGRHRRPDDP